jgi:hypothetical protein
VCSSDLAHVIYSPPLWRRSAMFYAVNLSRKQVKNSLNPLIPFVVFILMLPAESVKKTGYRTRRVVSTMSIVIVYSFFHVALSLPNRRCIGAVVTVATITV